MAILSISYSARMDIIVVSEPAPASKGNAKGTTEAVAVSASSSLNSSIPSIISNAIKAIMILPATANESTSTPIKPSNCSPRNRKLIIIIPVTMVASPGRMGDFSFIAIISGIAPITSMTAKGL